MAGHGLYVTAHGLYHLVVALGCAVDMVEKEIGGLVVPYKSVAESPQSVILGKLNVPVGCLEIPAVAWKFQRSGDGCSTSAFISFSGLTALNCSRIIRADRLSRPFTILEFTAHPILNASA